MKKTVSLFMIMIFIISSITQVSASDIIARELTHRNTKTIGELEMINNLKKQSNQELEAHGYAENEINEIRKFDPTEELFKRAQLDKEILENMGYSDRQIKILKKYEHKNDPKNIDEKNHITKEDMILLDSRLSVNMSQISFSHSPTNGTDAVVDFDWSWSILPLQRYYDIVAVSWGKEFNSNENNSYARVNYKSPVSGKLTTKTFTIDNKSANKGCSIKFPYNRDTYGGDAVSGYFRVFLYHPDKDISTFEVVGGYGHSYFTVIPSVGFPSGGSISFSGGISEHFDYLTVE